MTQTDQALAVRQAGGQIAQQQPIDNPWASVGLLKPYKADAVTTAPRVDALATISAGTKKPSQNGRLIPSASRDGTIYVHDEGGRAPGLVKVLEERGGKSLTIALVSNNPSDILQQRFAAYSASRLLAYGDERAITVLKARTRNGQEIKKQDGTVEIDRDVVHADDPEFANVAAGCKAQSSLYFALAKWEDGQPKLWFPDGLGLYRLRFTSLNSAENIKGSLAYVASLTGGKVAGIPLELAIVNREVSAPDGSRRTVPVWTLVLQPPETIELGPGQVRAILERGLEQAQSLALPAPRSETLEIADAEGADIDLDSAVIDAEGVPNFSSDNVRKLRGGGPCDPRYLRDNWFAAVKGSPLDSDEARRTFLFFYTEGKFESLAEFGMHATRRDVDELLVTANDWIKAEMERRREAGEPRPERESRVTARSYEALFGGDDDGVAEHQGHQTAFHEAGQTSLPAADEHVHQAAVLTGAPATAPSAEAPSAEAPSDERPIPGQQYLRAQWVEFCRLACIRLRKVDTAFIAEDFDKLRGQALADYTLGIMAEADAIEEAIAVAAEHDDGQADMAPAF